MLVLVFPFSFPFFEFLFCFLFCFCPFVPLFTRLMFPLLLSISLSLTPFIRLSPSLSISNPLPVHPSPRFSFPPLFITIVPLVYATSVIPFSLLQASFPASSPVFKQFSWFSLFLPTSVSRRNVSGLITVLPFPTLLYWTFFPSLSLFFSFSPSNPCSRLASRLVHF